MGALTHPIDIVGEGEQPNRMSRTVRGQVRIDTGDVLLNQQIRELYDAADRRVYELLGGPEAR